MTNFDEYLRQSEPAKREKSYAWQTAIGLQAVDALKPSEYLSAASQENEVSKRKICTLDYTLEETTVLQYIKENPRATQKDIAAHIGKSERTVKSITVSLVTKGIIER